MSRHRTPLPRRLLVWAVGVVLTGRFVDGPTEYELRQFGRARVAASLLAFGAALAFAAYYLVVMPPGVRNLVVGWPLVFVAFAAVPFLGHFLLKTGIDWGQLRTGRARRRSKS